ncbi:hypothetical protein AVEN_160261-1 [Araneus ventricosus]|uniref:Uncharacterized protein n=1 Tax=Araneus ventricosus TaxID=182803 RepID=A0A4Y2L545_ARAVE|nr:hypothetical protein AVEN_160261-1 [Araneus ventricosus]
MVAGGYTESLPSIVGWQGHGAFFEKNSWDVDQIDPCSGIIKSVRTETIVLIQGYFFLLGIAASKALRKPGHFHTGSEYPSSFFS